MAEKSILETQEQELWTTVEGVRMRYLRAGCGPPLILLHGLLGYSFSWRFNIAALAKHATVYAVDMPGAGFSERSNHLECSFRASAIRLLKFADAIGIGAFELLGTSHGGAVAMLAAAIANQPGCERVRRLILVAPVNPWSRHGRQIAPFLSARFISGAVSWYLQNWKLMYPIILRRLYGDPRKIAPGTLEGYSKPYREPRSFDYCFRILSTWVQDLDELARLLPQIADIPVLLIWGSLDKAVFPESAATVCKQFHKCELVMMEGVGHLPYEEAPDHFNAVVSKFLMKSG